MSTTIEHLKEKIKDLEKEIENLKSTNDWYRRRLREFDKLARKMPEPFQTLSLDIIANGVPRSWGVGKDIEEFADMEGILKDILAAAWFYTTEKANRQCSFCQEMMMENWKDLMDPDCHKDDCPLPAALKWLKWLALSSAEGLEESYADDD